MSLVCLVSGGLDSTVMAALSAEAGIEQYPLFIDYGQQSAQMELAACRASLANLRIEEPHVARVAGFGNLAPSGLTNAKLDVFIDAFTPCRNLFFLILGAAYAVTRGAQAVAIGLLNEKTAIFPDQTNEFLVEAEGVINTALGRRMKVVAPLMGCTKSDIIALAQSRGIEGTYSCHRGGINPCGVCVACREFHTQPEE